MIIRCLCTLVLFTTVFSIKTAAGSVDNLVTTMKFRGSQVVDFFVCNVGRRCNGLSRTPGADSHRSASLAGGTSALPKPFQQTPLRATTVAGHPRSDERRGLKLSGSRGGSGRTTRIVPDVGAFQWARIHDAVRLLAASGQPAHRSRRRRDGAPVTRHAEKETAPSPCGSRFDELGAARGQHGLCAADVSLLAETTVTKALVEAGGPRGFGPGVSVVGDRATRSVERLRTGAPAPQKEYPRVYYSNGTVRRRVRQRAKSQPYPAAALSAKYDFPQGREENEACARRACQDAAGIPVTALPPPIAGQEPIQFGEAQTLGSGPLPPFSLGSGGNPAAPPEFQSVPPEKSLPSPQDVNRAAATQDTTTVRGDVEGPDDAV